ncbi:SurA N-terminal domain-containing protein [Marinobacter daepoensis]|uniref:Periplasmic chaperone PpiD n=1 Tax=Marinobacter daepoensis TaxID=262077 RepID=A0ABS3BCA4_9GAMM|nr:SurA N-terminal domain-containing protein [Marinobacter daepoensis]MBN7769473.1 SurA N-terminal domain-containing protein [Marinobacter daepoensis]MBY6078163.1 SurA N-terminal domain-containing protein [Marinobacter daepoensis]
MLQDIRDNAQSTIAKVIVGLLIISLSIWGMDAIIGGFTGEPEVATVNGQDITEREFLRTVQMESQQRLMQMDNPDPSLLDEDQVRRDVLDALIQEAVLTQDARSQGLELTEADIDALIRQMPQFQVDGRYSPERMSATLRSLGMGSAEFRASMAKNYVVNQIRATVAQTGVIAPENAAQLLAIQNQTRDFSVLTLDAASVQAGVEITDAEVQAYYEDNQDQFRQPERVDAAYITLSQGVLAESVEITEDELRAYYDERAEEYAREERRAAHILIEAGGDAEETLRGLKQRLEDGESFADLAKEYSVDTGSAQEGGDLGYAGRGVYDEAFEKALFALEDGEVSEPVETTFGVHLIKLEGVRRSDVPSLESLRGELQTELARVKASERFAEVRSQLADAAYAADDLAGPAEELGLEIRVVEGVAQEGGAAPFDHAGLVRQLFSEDVLQGGYNTELIDVGDSVSVVARVLEHHEPRQLELAEVEQEIRELLEARGIREALSDRADELVARLESGDAIDELGAGEWQQFENQGRNVAGMSPFVVERVFSMARPEGDTPEVGRAVGAEEAAVIVLTSVNEGEVDQDGAEYQQLVRFLAQLEGQREYGAYQQYLRNTAEVERN